MEKNVIGATQAQPIEPLVYVLSPCDSGEGYNNSVRLLVVFCYNR
jgi:hypothetical protein